MANSAIAFNTEIRKLKPAHRYALGDILNVSDSWKKLMAMIPQSGTNTMRFNSEHVNIVEQMARKYNHNAAEILLDEWSTMGRERPTLQILLDLLIKAELFRAADYVASEILHVDLPQRPEYGPAAVIDISDETLAKLINKQAKLENTEYSKSASIVESSSEINVGEIKCLPDAVDLMDPCIFKNNVHDDESDKAILNSAGQDLIKFSTNKLFNKDIILSDTKLDKMVLKSSDKDLIQLCTNDVSNANTTENFKIDTKDENASQNALTNRESSVHCEFQEMVSQELPAFLNNFEQNENRSNELKTAELPAFLNQSSFLSNESVISSNNNSASTTDLSDSSNSSNCNFKHDNTEQESNEANYQLQTEINSILLPKYILDQNEARDELYATNDSKENVIMSADLPLTVLKYNT